MELTQKENKDITDCLLVGGNASLYLGRLEEGGLVELFCVVSPKDGIKQVIKVDTGSS